MESNKIVIASEIYPPDVGGPATFVERITPYLNKNGIKIQTITYADSNEKTHSLIKINRQTNLLFRYLKYFKYLFKISKASKLIFAQGPVAAGLPAIMVKKLSGKKVIIKIVGDVVWERARNKNKTIQNIDQFQKEKHGLGIKLHQKIRNSIVKQADLIITPSEYLKTIVAGWGINPEKIKVIYNAFEAKTSKLSREQAKAKLNLSGNIILSVGRLTSWKGFGTLIDLMSILLMKNRDFKLVIAGSGPEEGRLKDKISELKLEGKVILAGQVPQEKMITYYQAADIFILNSAYEGLSHTLLEALSYGLPSIASNKGGNPEVIEHNQNGLLVEYNNQQDILDAIFNLWQDKDKQAAFKEAAKDVLDKFSFDKMIENYLEVLR